MRYEFRKMYSVGLGLLEILPCSVQGQAQAAILSVKILALRKVDERCEGNH
jgi:hypothetical protein